MKFDPPEATLAYWKRKSESVQQEEIDRLEEHVKLKAPTSYREFLTQYGSVEFDHEINSQFTYRYSSEDQTDVRKQPISFIKEPVRAIQYFYQYLSGQQTEVGKELISFFMNPARTMQYYDGLKDDPDLSLPAFLVPFGMDYGQGELLIEFGQQTEKIYYWNFDAHDWETGETRIAFVADDLYQFFNSLAPYEESE